MPNTSLTGTFRPVVASRRGEAYAWAIAGTMAVATALTAWRTGSVPWFLWLFLGFFLGSAIISTFGHWVDSRTVLTLTPEGLDFQNGLRHVQLTWPQVESLRLVNDQWGTRVQVAGENGAHFAFRTMMTVEIHEGRPQRVMGFQEGEHLIATIIRQAGLERQTENDKETYYSRP